MKKMNSNLRQILIGFGLVCAIAVTSICSGTAIKLAGVVIVTVESLVAFLLLTFIPAVPILFFLSTKYQRKTVLIATIGLVGWAVGFALCCEVSLAAHSYTEVVPASHKFSKSALQDNSIYWDTVARGQMLLACQDLLDYGLFCALLGMTGAGATFQLLTLIRVKQNLSKVSV